MIKKVLFVILCLTAFSAIGCDTEPAENGQAVPPDSHGSVVNESPQPLPADESLPPAREINRGGEEYDYTGWKTK